MELKTTDILFVGRTGDGKSATANSIVGYRAFKSSGSPESVTKIAQFEYGEIDGRKLKVVDGPGVCDTSLKEAAAVKLVIKAMSFAISANPRGYHAILLVVRYGRYTQEHIEAIKILKDIFGDNFIKNHVILVMTHGDNFYNDEGNGAFDDWVHSQKGLFSELVKECCGRAILFDNATKDIYVKQEQSRKLLQKIDEMSGTRYTGDIFRRAQKTRDDLLKKCKTPKLNEEAIMECSLIYHSLDQIDLNYPEDAVAQIKSLKNRAEVLEQDILKQDQGTNFLKMAIRLAQQLNRLINEKRFTVAETVKLKQMELEFKMKHTHLDEEGDKRLKGELKQSENLKELQKAHKKLRKLNAEIDTERIEMMANEEENFKKNYEQIKEEQSWTWDGVAKGLASPVSSLVKWWFK